ncbi:hypothetical protein BH09ACT10_BH09ACT10_07000 [soil metagenome]
MAFGNAQDKKPSVRAQEALDSDPEEFAHQVVLNQLTTQARSRSDLAQALAKKHVPAEVATAVLDRFEEVGLIDDADFAQSWVTSRQRSKGLAPRALAQELRRKGIDDDVAREALGTIDVDDEREAARLLVRKKLRAMQSLDLPTKMRRLTGMLARKGYSGQMAFDIVRSELEQEAPPLESM